MTNLLFPHQQLLHERFLQTDVGQLYLAIPFDALAATIPPPRHSISGKGCKPWLDVKGGLALQFLKHYLCLSDALLMERINTDWSLQQVCGLQLKPHEVIRDTNLPAHWRSYLGGHLDIVALQKAFAAHWKAELTDTPISSQDATCYESRMPIPLPLSWCGSAAIKCMCVISTSESRQNNDRQGVIIRSGNKRFWSIRNPGKKPEHGKKGCSKNC